MDDSGQQNYGLIYEDDSKSQNVSPDNSGLIFIEGYKVSDGYTIHFGNHSGKLNKSFFEFEIPRMTMEVKSVCLTEGDGDAVALEQVAHCESLSEAGTWCYDPATAMLRIAVEKGDLNLAINISNTTSAISTVKDDNDKSDVLYDLGGRRVKADTKSLVIGKGTKTKKLPAP
ncbi:MAG: hypothetical protein ACI4B3_07270 [Prevotella sp.]